MIPTDQKGTRREGIQGNSYVAALILNFDTRWK